MRISAVSEHRCRLGEGPLWDSAAGVLYWVDSLGPTLYRHRFEDADTQQLMLPGHTVGSLAVRENGGLVLAMDQGFYLYDPQTGAIEALAQPLAGRDELRFNDGKVDPFGSFVAGAMNSDPHGTQNAAMYRLTPGLEVIEILDGFQCFNGPCFSPDGELLYVAGRRAGVIEVFDYGRDQWPRNPRTLVEGCNPDGATVDAAGFVWSAQWDDGCVLRITPDGRIDARLPVAGQVVSSVMFGGERFERIFVTTLGSEYYGALPGEHQPGRVLAIDDSGYRGRPEAVFKG